jgi:hypothetical protein
VVVKDSPTRDRRVVKRWALEAKPRGIALAGGTAYVGLSDRQSVLAIDTSTGAVLKEVVLDSEQIAATKELVAMRLDQAKNRLVIANGSDESVTILSLPSLAVTREITLEGEVIRDAVPDPAGRYLYILGRTVHVYDGDGEREIAAFDAVEPMAIAVSAKGNLLAVVGSEEFESGRATVVVLYDAATLKEVAREPLQTDREIQSAIFAAGDQALVVAGRDWLAEKSLIARPLKTMSAEAPRISFSFGDLVSSEKICLAEKSGPQILSAGRTSTVVHFVERRCGDTGSFTASPRRVSSASLYGIAAWATAYDPQSDSLWVTDPAGFITRYHAPRP